MPRRRAALIFALLAGCANAPTSLEEAKPPPSPIAARVEARLGEMAKFPPAVGKGKGKDAKSRVVLAAAMDAEGRFLTGERPTVAFSFRVLPPRPDTPPELRDGALLAATLDADGKNLVIAVRPTAAKIGVEEEDASGTHEAAYEKVQVFLARKRDEAGSHDGRLHVARVFGLDQTRLEGKYAGATLTAFVLGTKLVKTTAPPSYHLPGEGSWTLLRIVTPGDGYLALDWDAGRGELFPKTAGPSDLATAILNAM